MNRLFQVAIVFVVAVAAILVATKIEARQLTDTESSRVLGKGWLQVCSAVGTCECTALPPPAAGQGGIPCGGNCTPDNACRKCDGAGDYKACGLSLWYCGGAGAGCGDQWDGCMCYATPAGPECRKIAVSTYLGACRSSGCN